MRLHPGAIEQLLNVRVTTTDIEIAHGKWEPFYRGMRLVQFVACTMLTPNHR